MRDTKYATELARAEIEGGARIERLLIKDHNQEEIRFSWWVNGNMANRPLDLPEHELLNLLGAGIQSGVFTPDFLRELHTMLYDLKPREH